MQTECSAELFEFARVDGRAVVASFDGGAMTSDAGALLLGATDRVNRLTQRFAACFRDARNSAFVEHDVVAAWGLPLHDRDAHWRSAQLTDSIASCQVVGASALLPGTG